jgi:hypothetical protein
MTKANESIQPLVEYSFNLVRFGNRMLIEDVVLEIAESFVHCFRTSNQEVWTINSEGRPKPVDVKGERMPNKIVSVLSDNRSYIGIENSPEYYCAYSRDTVELYDKDLVKKGSFVIQ